MDLIILKLEKMAKDNNELTKDCGFRGIIVYEYTSYFPGVNFSYIALPK
jgi:hypothetical protein